MNLPAQSDPAAQDASAIIVRALQADGATGPLAARLYRAGADGKRDVLVVFFHGGGFMEGDLDEPDGFLRRLAATAGHPAVLSSSYTLAGVQPFPAAVEDAYAVLHWAAKHKAKLGWSGKRLLVAGIEAGANLAAVSALVARDRAGPRLAGQILLMPMLDPGLSTYSMRAMPASASHARRVNECAAAYLGYLPHIADRSHPYASPLQASRLKKLPPALILSTEDDPLRDEAEAYGAKLINAGIRTTVRRLAPAHLHHSGGRDDCGCGAQVLAEIAGFIALGSTDSLPGAVIAQARSA